MMEKEQIEKILQENRIVGTFEQLLPEFSATLGASVGTWLKNKATIAIARDFRTDSRMMKRAFTAGLMSTGVTALDFHGAPTPLLQFYIRRFGADAGVMFTSGHYEGDKTGIRIFDETGAELTSERLDEIREILKAGNIRRVPPAEMMNISDATGAIEVYIAGMKNVIEREAISKNNFKVVIDCALGPVSNVLPSMLTDMNVEVIAINSFNPKVIPKNLPNSNSLVSLAQTVRANEADLGIALDVEGSRAVFCDENGTLRSSDRIAAGLAAQVVQHTKGTLVLSESLSYNIEKNIVHSYGGNKHDIIRVRDQPGSIAQAIRDNQGIFGASDTGSFWAPSFTVDSDGIYTSFKLLELLANSDRPLSRYLDTLPQLPNNHREIVVPESKDNNLFTFLEYENNYDNLNFKYAHDTLAGTKVVFENGWVNLAPSSRDAKIIHLTSEADPFEISNDYLDAVMEKIEKFQNQAKHNK